MSRTDEFSQGKSKGKKSGSNETRKTKSNQAADICPPKKIKLNEDWCSKLTLIQEQRKQLPIYQHKEQLIEVLKQSKTLVIVGESGIGKSTQIPQFIVETKLNQGGKIAVTEPRRLAAISVATRVSQEDNYQVSEGTYSAVGSMPPNTRNY